MHLPNLSYLAFGQDFWISDFFPISARSPKLPTSESDDWDAYIGEYSIYIICLEREIGLKIFSKQLAFCECQKSRRSD